MNKATLVSATAAALFAVGAVATIANAESTVKCGGVNSCKGQSACKMGTSSCKGQNACKGQGWSESASASDCTSKGGKIL
jgi:uncharacterized membrane protein